jgi:hypothetical protein
MNWTGLLGSLDRMNENTAFQKISLAFREKSGQYIQYLAERP